MTEKDHNLCVHHHLNMIYSHPTDPDSGSVHEYCNLNHNLNDDVKKCKDFCSIWDWIRR